MDAPIELNFYDAEHEVVKTYRVAWIPTAMFRKSIALKNISFDDISDEQAVMVLNYVVDLFSNQFTLEDLEKHTELFDCFNTLRAVDTMAEQNARKYVNPTRPSSKRK